MKYFLLVLVLLGAVVTVGGATPEPVATPKTVLTAKAAARSSRAVRFSDVQLKTGVRLRYAEQGNPKGEPVILLHGYSDSWFSYSRILPLIDRKYHVYVPDQRHHALTDTRHPIPDTRCYGVVFAGTAVPSFCAFNFAAARS